VLEFILIDELCSVTEYFPVSILTVLHAACTLFLNLQYLFVLKSRFDLFVLARH
jgi:hypothetical protein